MCQAVSCEELIQIFNSGWSLSYDPDWFIEQIKEINEKIFVEGEKREQNRVSSLFFKADYENEFARKFEKKRAKYQQ